MIFRYYHDSGVGWCFARDGGTPVDIEQEFTSGVLRLSGFARQLTVVGHLERDGRYFVVYKPRRKNEIRGKQLTRSEYERYGFDPYAVAAEVFGLEVPEARVRAAEGGPWPAKTDEYLPEAVGLFRELSVAKRRHPYLSALSGHGASSSAFPHTRFRQISDPAGDSAVREREAGQAEVSGETLGDLSSVVRRHGDEMWTLRRDLKKLREAIESARSKDREGSGGGGDARAGKDGRWSRGIAGWAPTGVALVALVAAGMFAIESGRWAGTAEGRAAAAEAAAIAAQARAEEAEQRATVAVETAGAAEEVANTEAAAANVANARADTAERNAAEVARSVRIARETADEAVEKARNSANATRVAQADAQEAKNRARMAEQRAEEAEKRAAEAERLARVADNKADKSAAAAASAKTIAESAREAARGAAASVAALTEKAAAESDDGTPRESGDPGPPRE